MMRSLVLPCLALAVTGCESVDDAIDKQRPAVQQTFTRLTALEAKVKAAPPVAQPGVKPTDPPLRLDGPAANALFVYAEDLAQPGQIAQVALRTLDSLPLAQCGSLLTTKHLFADTVTRVSPSLATSYLETCSKLRYALVIRITGYLRPELSLETKQFAPGKYEAEVLVFDVTNGAQLGGFKVAATNDEQVKLLDGDPNHVQRLVGNLEAMVFDALRAGARTHVPGSLAPK